MQLVNGVTNKFKHRDNRDIIKDFNAQKIEEVFQFHQSMPVYQRTDLVKLEGLAENLGIGNLYVKNEGQRFNLKAFKGLGVSYALGKYFASELGLDLSKVSFSELLEIAKTKPKTTFATATDGNHGKSLAWAAQLFEQEAKVYMPKGSAEVRLEAVRQFGADVTETEVNYDDTVILSAEAAEDNNWVIVQDTAWEGYTEIPLAIMQGYSTIISEIKEQLGDKSFDEITHVVLQAGVGSFAAATAAALLSLRTNNNLRIIIVEPNQAACLYESARSEDGSSVRVLGDLDTMMAGLACGEPNPYAWEILRNTADHFYSCDDQISAVGMRVLGNNIYDQQRVTAGESGSVPIGFIYSILSKPNSQAVKDELGINQHSNILTINTEADTDSDNYRKVVWDLT